MRVATPRRAYVVPPAEPELVREAWPLHGKCGFCGDADGRHRLFDTMLERHRAGDSAAALAKDFLYPLNAVEALLGWWETAA